jgi:preprotein translocase SecE subunit
MARNRQRSKQRQAERRAARLAEQESRAPGAPGPGEAPAPVDEDGDGGALGRGRRPESAELADGGREPDQRHPEEEPDRGGIAPPGIEAQTGAELAASAPPEAIGRSDTVVETPPPPLLADPEEDPEAAASRATVGEAADEPAETREHGKVVAFLIAVWAELKRVQWPNRQQTTTLTGIVLGFVIIMGAYLGALDAIFSRLIQLII